MFRVSERSVPRIIGGILLTTATLSAGMLIARSSGVSGVSQNSDGCDCHDPTPNANGNVTVDITGPSLVGLNSTNEYTVTVSGLPAGTTGGFNLASSAGTLVPGTNNQLDNGELVHVDETSRSWTFEWQAPGSDGTESFWAVGMASDGSGRGGDSWNWYGDAQSTPFDITVSSTVGIGDVPVAALQMSPPHPSPFAGTTRVEFVLAREGRADLQVISANGRRVVTLASGPRGAGKHVIRWDGRDAAGQTVARGVYFLRLEADGVVKTQRVVKY